MAYKVIKTTIMSMKNTTEAIGFVKGLDLTVKQVKELAEEMGCVLFGCTKKEDMIKLLVRGTLGSKLDYEAVMRT